MLKAKKVALHNISPGNKNKEVGLGGCFVCFVTLMVTTFIPFFCNIL